MKETKKSKSLLTAAAVLTVLTVGMVGAGSVLAYGPKVGSGMDDLVQNIASKFNLNTSEVQVVFDEHRVEMHEQMLVEREQWEADRLAKAVETGKITQEQANAITAKLKELRPSVDELKDLDAADRGGIMRENMDELKQWAEDNNIPFSLLMGGWHRGNEIGNCSGGQKMMGGFRHGQLGNN